MWMSCIVLQVLHSAIHIHSYAGGSDYFVRIQGSENFTLPVIIEPIDPLPPDSESLRTKSVV